MNEVALDLKASSIVPLPQRPGRHAGLVRVVFVMVKLVAVVLLLIGTVLEATLRAILSLTTPPLP